MFQMEFYLIHNGKRKTPLHVALSELIHDSSRSKKVIQIMNRLGLCMSYDELERIDIGLEKRNIDMAGDYRVPIPPAILSSKVIHGVMDNFDHEENTSSGISGSHDVVLVLFQNRETDQNGLQQEISQKHPDHDCRDQRSLDCILDCQKLLRAGKFSARGKISDKFDLSNAEPSTNSTKINKQDHQLWLLA